MKKALLLILLLPFFFMFGCGGGIDAPTPVGGGDDIGPGGDPVAGLENNVSVYLPPVQGAAQKAIITNGDNLIRNAARLVATHDDIVGQECIEFITASGVDPDEGPYFITECNDPLKEIVTDATGNQFIQVIGGPPGTPNPGAYVNVIDIVAEAISDGPLDAAGSGTLEIAVPPGTDYTLHVLTYVSGDFDAAADTFTPAAITVGPNNRIVMGPNTRNILKEYGKPAVFDVAPGLEVELTPAWEPVASLTLPADPVDAGDLYTVTAQMSDALADNWYIQQLISVDNTDDHLLDWFISEGGDIDGTASGTSMELDSEIVSGLPAPRDIWHFAQFFISSDLLASNESWTRWSFCTTDAGELNPWGVIIVNP